MISVSTALSHVLEKRTSFGEELVDLELIQGRVLAEDIFADRDFPPFDRVAMDGIALSYACLDNGINRLSIQEIQAAGSPQTQLRNSQGFCIEVMTGAILPLNCDTVVPYEQIDKSVEDVEVDKNVAILNKNIHLKGSDQKREDLLIKKGKTLNAGDIGVLATVGKSEVLVYRTPAIALLSTGDELVAVSENPAAYQIRRSNTIFMKSDLRKRGFLADDYHFEDDLEGLKLKLADLLVRYDVIICSGAVSKGKFDFLPQALEELEVGTIFHRVAQRPGKPFWFGSKGEKLVFGFPGNPVSTFVCYYYYFLSWINGEETEEYAILKERIEFRPELTLFQPVKLLSDGGAIPIKLNGSGDLVGLSLADGMLVLPQDKSVFVEGENYRLIRF
jgi:molybdopterin molybdotransferase